MSVTRLERHGTKTGIHRSTRIDARRIYQLNTSPRQAHKKDTGQVPKPPPELFTTCSDSSPPVNTNARRPLPSLTPLGSLGTSGPFVVRGVRDLTLINLDDGILLVERFLEVRVPTS